MSYYPPRNDCPGCGRIVIGAGAEGHADGCVFEERNTLQIDRRPDEIRALLAKIGKRRPDLCWKGAVSQRKVAAALGISMRSMSRWVVDPPRLFLYALKGLAGK